jgi:membrane protein YdbS with pleckstrin-like domain
MKLHPKAKTALMIKPMIGITIFVVIFLLPWIVVILDYGWPLAYLIGLFFLLLFVFFFIIILWANMFYNRYMFRIGDDAVYINRGILWKRNVTIPYGRIQHTSTTRGPIDILLGLHILNIFTAGTGSVGARFGGAASAFAAEGSIPGLEDPKPFQEAIMSRVRALRGDGLGTMRPAPIRVPPIDGDAPGEIPATPITGLQSDVQKEMLSELKRIREILEDQDKK